jgi:cytochrome P450
VDIDREGAGFFLNGPARLDDPYADFRYFRQHRPVFHYAQLNSWFVFRYDEVAQLLADERLSANRMNAFLETTPAPVRADVERVAPYLEKFMLMQDAGEHARTRRCVELAFKNSLDSLRAGISDAAKTLLDRAMRARKLDVAAGYAFLMPAWALSDLLGVRPEDRGRVVQWSLDFIDFFNFVPITVDTASRMVRSALELRDYMLNLLAERRAAPRHDFLGTLLDESERGAGLTEDEIVANGMLLLLAGHVAVRNLIGNTVYLLLKHAEQFAALRSRPELLSNAIEESLRYESPVAMIPRVALEDLEVAGQRIKRGELLQLVIASANRDEAHFSDPERFDITRTQSRILSFGHGPHGCLGAHLARMEAEIALSALFARSPEPGLDESQSIVWYRNAGNRGPINLHILL